MGLGSSCGGPKSYRNRVERHHKREEVCVWHDCQKQGACTGLGRQFYRAFPRISEKSRSANVHKRIKLNRMTKVRHKSFGKQENRVVFVCQMLIGELHSRRFNLKIGPTIKNERVHNVWTQDAARASPKPPAPAREGKADADIPARRLVIRRSRSRTGSLRGWHSNMQGVVFHCGFASCEPWAVSHLASRRACSLRDASAGLAATFPQPCTYAWRLKNGR